MNSISTVALFAGCMIPGCYMAYTDAKYRLLYNKITLPVLLLGLIYSAYQGDIKSSLYGAAFGFFIMLVFTLMGGIGAGDVKLAAGLGAWFGYPNIIYIIVIGSLFGSLWGLRKLKQMGVLKDRMTLFLRGCYLKCAYRTKEIMALPKLPEEGIPEESIPYGTFLVLGTWVIFIKEVILPCLL